MPGIEGAECENHHERETGIAGQNMATVDKRFEWISKTLLVIWVILLIPDLLLIAPIAMAFDGGYTWQAYLAVACVWSYPFVLAAAVLFRKVAPALILLPAVNVAALFIGELFGPPHAT